MLLLGVVSSIVFLVFALRFANLQFKNPRHIINVTLSDVTHALRTAGEAVLVADVAGSGLEGLLLDEVGDGSSGAVAVDQLGGDVVGAAAGQRPRNVTEVPAL